MNIKLKEKIEEEMVNLPKELQEVIKSFDWGKATEEIGKKHLLDESEVNDLQTETGLVLIGLTSADSYASNVESNVGLSKEEAEKIAAEVDIKIFGPIYKKLSENMEKNLKDRNPNWKQVVNFVVSGGDYSVFTQKDEPKSYLESLKSDKNSRIEDIKSKFVI